MPLTLAFERLGGQALLLAWRASDKVLGAGVAPQSGGIEAQVGPTKALVQTAPASVKERRFSIDPPDVISHDSPDMTTRCVPFATPRP